MDNARLGTDGLRRGSLRPLEHRGRRLVGMKRAARFTSRMSNERSAVELHPQKWSGWTELHRRLSLGTAVF